MKTADEIAEQVSASEKFAGLTVEDLGLSVDEMMVAAVEADRAQRAVGEDEELDTDPRFPGRPTHPDFARISAAVIVIDDLADSELPVDEIVSADMESLIYAAKNRIGKYTGHLPASIPVQLIGIYIDAFQLGVAFTNRGGHRPVKTGTAGEGSSS